MQKLIVILSCFFTSIFSSYASFPTEQELKNGDIIFIVSASGQGKAIQLATKSNYTHVGVVFIEDGKAMVYHAVEPVTKSTLDEFVSMSQDGKYMVRRLKDQSKLNQETISKMLSEARSELGKHYDSYFSWNDKELYCSEYVWKLYEHNLGIKIGTLKKLKDFDLSNPIVKEKLKQRYGSKIPMDEYMISPGDMYNSDLLE